MKRGMTYKIDSGTHAGHQATVIGTKFRKRRRIFGIWFSRIESGVQLVVSRCSCGKKWEWENREPMRSF